jgi:hypothetical protein
MEITVYIGESIIIYPDLEINFDYIIGDRVKLIVKDQCGRGHNRAKLGDKIKVYKDTYLKILKIKDYKIVLKIHTDCNFILDRYANIIYIAVHM